MLHIALPVEVVVVVTVGTVEVDIPIVINSIYIFCSV